MSSGKQRVVFLIISAGIVSILVWLVGFSGIPINHDASMHLQCAQMLLLKEVPYIDYVEPNPPYVHYLHTVPVLIARSLGLAVPAVFQWLILGLVLVSVGLYGRVRRLRVDAAAPADLYLFMITVLLFSVYVFRSGGFGQREHLFMLGFFPWLECRCARHERRPIPIHVALGVALMLGSFALLKPHFVFIVCACELALLACSRYWRALLTPEIALCILLAGGYLSQFLFLPHAAREIYFHRWVPAMMTSYSVYNMPFWEMFWSIRMWRLIFLLSGVTMAVAWLLANLKVDSRLDLFGWTAGCLASACMFFIQHKGFAYHFFPFFGTFLLLFLSTSRVGFGVVVSGWSERRRLLSFTVRTVAETGVALMALCCVLVWSKNVLRDKALIFPSMNSGLLEVIKTQCSPKDRVLCLTTGVIWIYPMLVYADRLPGSRYLQAFPVAFSYEGVKAERGQTFPYRSLDNAPPDERLYLEEITEDLGRYRPGLVLIQATPSSDGCAPGFCMRDYLQNNGWIPRNLTAYMNLGCVGGFDVYRRNAVILPQRETGKGQVTQ